TIWSAVVQVQPECEAVPIGLPIANTQFYVLDAHQQVVPVGVPGELHIGGQGLAQGYLNRAELTAERFIPHPFAQQPGERLYKTGDLVRYRLDGTLTFLGRLDHQVKLRGFRIELGEIEAALQLHEQVQQGVVQVRQERLVAYLVPAHSSPDEGVESLAKTLRASLQQRLPAYMIPTAFVPLASFPLTPNGKIDRQKLPEPDLQQPTSEFVAARSPLEEALSQIWAQVLGLEQVSIHDNFFELGGHSLRATQVMSQLRAVFQIEIPLRSLFAHPTIAALAAQVAIAQQTDSLTQSNAISPAPRDRPLPLSFAQQRLWFLDQLQPGNAAYTMPTAVRLQGDLDLDALQQSLDALMQRQEGLRTRFAIADGQPIQVVDSPTPFAFTVESLESLSPSDQQTTLQQRIVEATHHPFDLTRSPLCRLVLLRLAEAEHVAIFTLHHIITDGWSMGVLVRELAALYTAYATGHPPSLPPLPIQYADFAVWQRQWLQGEVLEQQLTYWHQQLAGSQPMVLPSDRPRSEIPNLQGGTEPFHLTAGVTAQLRSLSRTADASLFMMLLAGFNVLLARHSQREDIVVGTDVANRNRAELEGVIGFFVNLLVLRTDLSGNPPFTDLLKRVREVCLDAYAHQDLPFAKLVEALSLERQAGETPLFQVLFVLQNVPTATLQLPDLALTPLDVNNSMAKFDISLFLHETEQELVGTWRYRTDLFDAATIQRLSRQLETLFSQVVAQPDARIQSLDMLTETERTQQTMTHLKQAERKFNRFKQIKPKAVSLTQKPLIQTRHLQPNQSLPLVVQPSSDETDLIDWAAHHRDWLNQHLYQHGAILFRSRQIETVTTFEQFAQAICPSLFGDYGDLPRVGVGGKVYRSTPYPADRAILFHNESSHLSCYPMKIGFYCVQPAQAGGETPIVDGRQVYQQLDPELRETFAAQGLMYVRNFVEGLDVSWQQFFQTDDRAQVEAHCRQSGITWEWTDTGLRTRQIRPAIAIHPQTGDRVWFNQLLLHHVACLDAPVRQSMLASLGEDHLPRHVYYGDGTPIPDDVIEAIQTTYTQAAIAFPWQAGDVLMLDNVLTAHGRNPYRGTRQIVVAMGEMVSSSAVNPRSN
ncbi:MAG: condensation domain-containing protein, partial [Leptolyngbyaceae cyanobacterium]